MHDLDRIRAELGEDALDTDEFFEHPFEDPDDELEVPLMDDEESDEDSFADEDSFHEYEAWTAEPDDDAPLGDDEELELAAELLSARDDEELERTIRRVVRPRPPRRRRRPVRARRRGHLPLRRRRRPGARQRGRRRRLLGKALKGIARKALPIVGGAVGSLVAPGVGTAAGAALARNAGKAFGLELEGLSPEDQELEVARGVVRLGAAAAEETDQIDADVDDETAAKVSVIRASKDHAPGVVPRRGHPHRRPPRGRRGTRGAASGRWVRRDGHVVLLGL